MDTDEAIPSNTSTTISDKIATSPNRATAVDPTTRTQITPADQARARGNQQADLAQNKKKNFSPSSLVPGHRLQQQMSSASVNAACAPLALAPAAGEAAGAPADVGFIASAPRAAEPSGRHRAGEKEPAPNRAPRGARIILDRPGPLPPVTAAATRVTITGSGARAPASERVVFATSRKSERGAKAGADDARCSCAVWKTVGDETAMKRSPGAKACRRRRHRRCWTTRARENKRRSALKTMLAVVPPLLLAALLWQMLAVEAVFTPRTRAELQGDGGAEKGVFGCVGKCGASLAGAGAASSYCSIGSWTSGTGICANANSGVPSDQGTGTYGVIGSWDVSGVRDMAYSELRLSKNINCAAAAGCPLLCPGLTSPPLPILPRNLSPEVTPPTFYFFSLLFVVVSFGHIRLLHKVYLNIPSILISPSLPILVLFFFS